MTMHKAVWWHFVTLTFHEIPIKGLLFPVQAPLCRQ